MRYAMKEQLLDQFVNQPYVSQLFNQVAANLTDLNVDVTQFQDTMKESGEDVVLYIDNDLAYLERKVEYINSTEALPELQSVMKAKLQTLTEEELQRHIELMQYFESDAYKKIVQLEDESFVEFTQQVNDMQKLVKISL